MTFLIVMLPGIPKSFLKGSEVQKTGPSKIESLVPPNPNIPMPLSKPGTSKGKFCYIYYLNK